MKAQAMRTNSSNAERRLKTGRSSDSHSSTAPTKATKVAPYGRPSHKSNGSRRAPIPQEALDYLGSELRRLGDPRIDVSVGQRFCYVSYAGQPLCRLGYRGSTPEWDFAIYKFSSGSYGHLDLAPDRGSPYECVDLALRAYDCR